MNSLKILAFLAVAFFSGSLFAAGNDSGMLRFPDINNDLVAFVYAGDIWTVDADGGDARRLTSHLGMELFPKISPDGKWIAFSGEYSGSRQVFIIPAKGGQPKQLTFYNDVGAMPPRGGWDNITLDWTPDSKKIMIRSNRTPFGERVGKYFLVDIKGGLETPLAIPEGGLGSLSPDGKQVCYTPIGREFRTWKRYKGGRAADVWTYNLETNEATQITQFAGSDQIPIWYGNKLYFASDRDLTMNIFSFDLGSSEIKKMTNFDEYDVMWPSGSNGFLVYENGGYIYKLNLNSGENSRLTIHVNYDNPNTLPYFKNVKENIHSYSISPTGKRALFDARGDIFSVPATHGEIENLTQTQGVREVFPAWSPDGRYISYYSDASGEYELYLLENTIGAEPRKLTNNSKAWMYEGLWSDDSRYFVFFDRSMKLKMVEIESGSIKVVDEATTNEIRDYAFSSDSKWLTYSKGPDNGQNAIWVYQLSSERKQQVTDDVFEDWGPVFSKDGNYIYFLSNRDFNLDFSSFEFDYLYNKATKIYALALMNDAPKLFPEKNDVEEIQKASEEVKGKGKKGKNKEEEAGKEELSIDFHNIENRVTALPMPAGDYGGLIPVDGGLLYTNRKGVHRFLLDGQKDEVILADVGGIEVSSDGKKLLYRGGGQYGIVDVSPGQKVGNGALSLDNLEMKIDPVKEWKQIFNDGWRIFRDYFYVDNLHDVDWEGMHDRYERLLPSVGHRADLDYILGELIGESNTGHSYVNYGDFEKVKRMDTGLLGADIEWDDDANAYRFVKIFDGENWNEKRRSPLTEHGVAVKEGDFLLGINGNRLSKKVNPYLYLENTLGKLVELRINSKPTGEGSKTIKVKPIASEGELRYLDWVNSRRDKVEELSGGRIGYIHVPNTAIEGNRELHRGMYAYHNKEALIIDDRYNGGGFIPDVMVDLLDRKNLVYWTRKGLKPNATPGIAHDGPKAMLINHYSSSGGDAFPYFFRKKGLGTLIGTRTWGGLVGISGNAGLVDGGYIAVPRFGVFEKEDGWIVEGVGVYPDIEVIDRPDLIVKGEDPSLERAVEELLKELGNTKKEKVVAPEGPNRSKWIEKNIE